MMIGVLGVGHLAASLVEGLMLSGMAGSRILLAPRGKAEAISSRHGIRIASSNEALVEETDIVILSVRPADAARSIEQLPWREDQVLVSVCAGVQIAELNAGPASIVRAMPLTAAEIGMSPTAFFPDQADVRAILGRLGKAIPLASEREFETVTVSAAVYGWVQDLIRQTVAWTVSNGGDSDRSREIVALAFAAAGSMIAQKQLPIENLLEELVTPGGITELGLSTLQAGGQPEIWAQACDAVHRRLIGKAADVAPKHRGADLEGST